MVQPYAMNLKDRKPYNGKIALWRQKESNWRVLLMIRACH
jgi:hypothetical protein